MQVMSVNLPCWKRCCGCWRGQQHRQNEKRKNWEDSGAFTFFWRPSLSNAWNIYVLCVIIPSDAWFLRVCSFAVIWIKIPRIIVLQRNWLIHSCHRIHRFVNYNSSDLGLLILITLKERPLRVKIICYIFSLTHMSGSRSRIFVEKFLIWCLVWPRKRTEFPLKTRSQNKMPFQLLYKAVNFVYVLQRMSTLMTSKQILREQESWH